MESVMKLVTGGLVAAVLGLAGYLAYVAIAGSLTAALVASPHTVKELVQSDVAQFRDQCQEHQGCPTPQSTIEVIDEGDQYKAVDCHRAGNIIQQFIFNLLKFPAQGYDGFIHTADGQSIASISNPPYNSYLIITGRTDVVGNELLQMSGAKSKWEFLNSLKALRGNAQVKFYEDMKQYEARIPVDRNQWGCP